MVIDDVIVRKGRGSVELDVRVRNPEDGVVNITRADLVVLERTPFAAVPEVSASYDLLLKGEHNSIAVAHVLKANEVDRFVIKVGFTLYNTSCWFRVKLSLRYNQDQTAESEPFGITS
jgi:hypothetical protein